jgi:hypothetical protein
VLRTLAVAGAGVWLGLLAGSWMIASISFKTAAALAGSEGRRELHERLAGASDEGRRQVIRHVASEVNRAMFGRWIVVQLLLGIVTAVLVARAGGSWPLAAAALAIAVVQAGLHAPILEIGRAIDFVPRPLAADVAARFGRLHGAYVLLDLAKATALVWLVVRLARMGR